MTQDITTIIDGIKRSVEAVGRSGRDDVYLDNVSFRCDVSRLDVPHDSNVAEAERISSLIVQGFDAENYSYDLGHVLLNALAEEFDHVISLQMLPARRTTDGLFIDMTVTVSCVDVTNQLPQTVLTSEMVLHQVASAIDAKPGRITFNIAHAYVFWEDVDQLVEWDDIEIPR